MRFPTVFCQPLTQGSPFGGFGGSAQPPPLRWDRQSRSEATPRERGRTGIGAADARAPESCSRETHSQASGGSGRAPGSHKRSASDRASAPRPALFGLTCDVHDCRFRLQTTPFTAAGRQTRASATRASAKRECPGARRAPVAHRGRTPARPEELHKKGHLTTGHRLFCKEFLCFNTIPCRPMPLLV